MEPDSLVELVKSGNIGTVEQEWMGIIESPEVSPKKLAAYAKVLSEMCQANKCPQAGELAWSAIESLSSRYSPSETLTAAGPFLLGIGDNAEVRASVTELYRKAYADCQGLDELLTEAGIAGGRPVRRALRTLDVCLRLEEGDYLAARHEDAVARIDSIERPSWEFSITLDGEQNTLGPVHLADTYRPVPATDFHVLMHFAPEEVAKLLRNDPVTIVTDICRRHGGRIDSDELADELVPRLMDEAEWKKWWTRARTALKKSPHVTLTGRSPYEITYSAKPVPAEELFIRDFRTLRDPNKQWSLIEKYVRECKLRDSDPDPAVMRECYEDFRGRAQRMTASGAIAAGLHWMIASYVGELAGVADAEAGALELFREAQDPAALLRSIDSDVLVTRAWQYLIEAKPESWRDELIEILPALPLAACDGVAQRLIESGRSVADFEPVIERILASPLPHFDALLWLWNGPSNKELLANVTPISILTRILRTLEFARLSDDVPNDALKRMKAVARAVVPARKRERFRECLDGLEPGVARTLKLQISRGEGFGYSVRDDLVREIERRLPTEAAEPEIEPWKREDILFATRAGISRKQEEIDHHLNVKMAENARAIGAAAERGDLSENSEYKFALEERDLLRARLAQMNSEMAIAQVIDPDDVSTEHIDIGTRAVFRRMADGAEYAMTFVGPWEADSEKAMFNYRAPLAQRLMGMRIGDEVEFDHADVSGKYEIVALHNSLAD